MKSNKRILSWLFVSFFTLFALVCAVHAQAVTSPVVEPTATTPSAAANIVALLTPLVVPLVIAGVKKVLPSIPSWVLPVIAPVLGVLIGIIDNAFTAHASNLWVAALLGLAGVGVREVVDQTKQVATDPVTVVTTT